MYIMFKSFFFCKGIDNGIAKRSISFSEMFLFFVLVHISSKLVITKNPTTSFSNILWAQSSREKFLEHHPLSVHMWDKEICSNEMELCGARGRWDESYAAETHP